MYPELSFLFFSITFFSLFSDAYIVKKFKKIEKCLESTSYDWAMEASRKCENEEYYHCLHDVNNRDIFYEFCGDFITVRPGKYPAFELYPYDIVLQECVGDTYQDKYLKSSELNNCFKRKKCNDIGQLVCEDGSKTEDRRCKCDINKGMVIKIYGDSPSNQMTCCPDTDRSCDCWPKKCDLGFVLNEVYQCVKKCETSDCSTTSSHDVTETTLRPTTVLASSADTSTFSASTSSNNPKTSDNISTATRIFVAFSSVIVLILLIILASYCYFHKPYNRFTTASCKDRSDDNQEEGQRMTEIKKKQPDGNQEERQRLTEKQEERHVTHIGSLMIYNIDNCDNVATGTGASITTSNKDQDDDETHVKYIFDEESSDFQGF